MFVCCEFDCVVFARCAVGPIWAGSSVLLDMMALWGIMFVFAAAWLIEQGKDESWGVKRDGDDAGEERCA